MYRILVIYRWSEHISANGGAAGVMRDRVLKFGSTHSANCAAEKILELNSKRMTHGSLSIDVVKLYEDN